MKLKQFFTLSALTLLFGAFTANAQLASFSSTTGPLDNLPHDCVAKTSYGTQVLLLNPDDVVVQSFTSCTKGEARKAYVLVNQTIGNGKLAVTIEDGRTGEELAYTKVVMREGFSGLVTAKFNAKVENGMSYNLKLKALGDLSLVVEGKYDAQPGVDLHLNGWKLDGTIATAVGMTTINEITVVQGDRNESTADALEDRSTELAATFLTYPNPFTNNFTVEFAKDLKGETQVILMDLTGNIIHREVRSNAHAGDRVNINPRYFLNPGAYALRVINDQRVFNKTIMKN